MFSKQRIDSAVSPVVGVILMVAVTVILAAVIGSFVLDLGSNTQQNPQAGVTFDTDASGNEVTATVVSAENVDSLELQDSNDGITGDAASLDEPSAGDTLSSGDLGANSGTITLVGELDGKSSVIQSYEYDFSS